MSTITASNGRGSLASGLVLGLVCLSLPGRARGDDAPKADRAPPNLEVTGRLAAGRGISVPNFNLKPGGVLEWPDKLRMSHGGGERSGLPPQNTLVRAQPGGNIVLQPQGDYMRCAVDLLPTRGRQADVDAIGEFTIHRLRPTATTQEMISYSALARKQDVYAVVVEAHGDGRLKPLVFMDVQGGLRNPNEAFSAEAMRMTEEGTMVFGLHRQGGRLTRPLDSITIEQPEPTERGTYDSDNLTWVGKGHDGARTHRTKWRARVRVNTPSAASSFTVQANRNSGEYANRLEVNDTGDVELPTAGAAVVLRSPNGKRWRVTVNDSGQLQATAAP